MSKKFVKTLKSFPIFITLNGLLTSMDSLMNAKLCSTNKVCSTFRALKEFHIRMSSQMLIELGLTSEG